MPDAADIRAKLESRGTIERLAAIEHDRWAHWQRYVHDRCERLVDGSLVIPAELVLRWEGQMQTPYLELSPNEQESDREQVHRYLSTIIEILSDYDVPS